MKKPKNIFKSHNLANWIISQFPENYESMIYVEPFGMNVLFNKKISEEEVINDIDSRTTTILRIIRDKPKELIDCLKKVKFKQEIYEFAVSRKTTINEMDKAVNELIIRKMIDKNTWKELIEAIPGINSRLEKVNIFNKDCLEVVKAYNSKDILLVLNQLDISKISREKHISLIEYLKRYKGKAIISGISSPIYDKFLVSWKNIKRNSKLESLWVNF